MGTWASASSIKFQDSVWVLSTSRHACTSTNQKEYRKQETLPRHGMGMPEPRLSIKLIKWRMGILLRKRRRPESSLLFLLFVFWLQTPLKWHCELLYVADGLLRSQLSAIAASVNTISSRTTNQPRRRRRRRWRRNCAASVLLDNVTFLRSRDRRHPLVIYLSVGCADALLLHSPCQPKPAYPDRQCPILHRGVPKHKWPDLPREMTWDIRMRCCGGGVGVCGEQELAKGLENIVVSSFCCFFLPCTTKSIIASGEYLPLTRHVYSPESRDNKGLKWSPKLSACSTICGGGRERRRRRADETWVSKLCYLWQSNVCCSVFMYVSCV